MKKILFASLLFMILPAVSFSQKEANIWYFGELAGLDFNSGKPVALTNSILSTGEACASISDSNGNLLFYTEGEYVINKQHQYIDPDSSLNGCASSTQGALIIPSPASGSIYFVFTTHCAEDSSRLGLAYSIVDMSQNGGLGKITVRNVGLYQPTTEKLTAIRHSNGRDVWVISHAHNSNAFLAYLVTASGVSATPVITNIGPAYGRWAGGLAGQLKVSPDGNKIASAKIMADSSLELYHFNRSTGVLSDRLAFRFPGYGCYGVEFSPDCRKLYCTGGIDSNYSTKEIRSALFQFDVSGPWNSSSINQSRRLVSIARDGLYDALQLGPDKKIYCATYFSDYLAAIGSPNNDSCDFSDTAVHLGGSTSWYHKSYHGLPGFIQNQFYTTPVTSVANQERAFDIQVYPNPFSKTATINLNKYSRGPFTLVLYDAIGSVVYQTTVYAGPIQLSRDNLPAGVYVLQLRAGSGLICKKKLVIVD